MRVLKKEEARNLISKIIKFHGDYTVNLFEKNFYSSKILRLQKNKVFFISLFLGARVASFSKKKIASMGICIGRFTKSKKFHLLIPALGILVFETKENSIILNLKGENSYIFGSHLIRENILEISKFLFKGDGVVVLGPFKLPLGFGEVLKNASKLMFTNGKEMVVVNHGDIGKYIRINK